MRFGLVALLLAGGLAHAEEAPPAVNLLRSVPSTVAVSSTVANANLLPEHLVDGRLATAWNSRTGELVGAWIAVRLPAGVRIKAIKLTAGFVHKEAKVDRGGARDLFTMNPRIKKVRISRAGQAVLEHTLDVDRRGLQEIPVDLPGGDVEIRVLEVVPGSRPGWREICVSELEVWGVLGPGLQATKAAPAVRIGSLDAAPTLTREQCIKALFPSARAGRIGPDPSDEIITHAEAVPLREDVVICRVAHALKGASTTTSTIAAVRRGAQPVRLGEALSVDTTTQERPDGEISAHGSVGLVPFPLTTTESGLLVEKTQSESGPMMDDGSTASTLYRVTAAGLVAVLDFKSTWSRGEAENDDECTLQPPALTRGMPGRLVLDCIKREGRWHGQDPRGNGLFETPHKERYVWKGARYEKK